MTEIVKIVGFDADTGPIINKTNELIKQLGLVGNAIRGLSAAKASPDLNVQETRKQAREIIETAELVAASIAKIGRDDSAASLTGRNQQLLATLDAYEKRLQNVRVLEEELARVRAANAARLEADPNAKPVERPRVGPEIAGLVQEGPAAALAEKIAATSEKLKASQEAITRAQANQATSSAAIEQGQRRLNELTKQREALLRRQEALSKKIEKPEAAERQAQASQRALDARIATQQRALSDPSKRVAAEKEITRLTKEREAAAAAERAAGKQLAEPRRDGAGVARELLSVEKDIRAAKAANAELDKQAKQAARELTAAVREQAKLEERLATLQAKQAEGPSPLGARPRVGQLETEKDAQGAAARAEELKIARLIADQEAEIVAMQARDPEAWRLSLGYAKDTQFVAERIDRILSGDSASDFSRSYLNALEEQERVLLRNRALIKEQIKEGLGRGGDRRARDTAIAENQIKEAKAEQVRVARELAALDERASSTAGKTADEQKRLAAARQELSARNQQAIEKQEAAQVRLNKLEAMAKEAARIAGGEGPLRKIDEDLAANQELQLKVQGGGIESVIPNYQKLRREIEQINKQIQLAGKDEARVNELMRERIGIVKQIETLQNQALEAVKRQELSQESLREAQIAGMPVLERSLIGAFDDMFRRFQATLQFAISGALIFGAQQLVRTFIETAIQVERTFADIETAFAFDFTGEVDGTQFENEIQKIRVSTLDLADEFNVLPTVANDAIFQMVARFGDANKALEATRAQLLATKVSGIDQAEVLRALSAVAENFAASTLRSNEALSLQQRLLDREAAALDNYGKALDIAVFIQQKFGVETEDTLEGVARLAPAFSQLGFTMEQTASIVASVSRELGQTGQNVAERLNRALGQLTEPSIRDKLLELAAANENLTLTIADFESGPKALEALIAGYKELVAAGDDAAAFQLLNELGQRRELEVVAALFNTTDLQESIEDSLSGAAGAADQRFGALNKTIAETLLSIAGGFERLAQNFQKLGFLSPLEALLVGVDKLLNLLNSMLETIDTAITQLGVMGDIIKYIAGFSAAGFGVARLGGALVNTATAAGIGIQGAAATAQAAGVDTATVALLGAKGKELTSRFQDLSLQMKNNRLPFTLLIRTVFEAAFALAKIPLAVASAGLNAGLGKVQSVIGARLLAREAAGQAVSQRALNLATLPTAAFSTAVVGATAAIGALVVTVVAARSAMEKSAAVARDEANARQISAISARRQRFLGDIPDTDEAETVARIQSEIDQFEQTRGENIMGGFEQFIRELGTTNAAEKRLLEDEAALRQWADWVGISVAEAMAQIGGFDLGDVSGRSTTEFIQQGGLPGTKEYEERREVQLGQSLVRAQAAELRALLTGLVVEEDAVTRRRGGNQTRTGVLQTAATQEIDDALRLAEIARTPAEIEIAKAQIVEALTAYETFAEELGVSVEALEGTAATLRGRISKAQSRFSLGRIGRTEQIEELEAVRRDALAEAGRLQRNPNQVADSSQLIEERLAIADEALVAIIQAKASAFESARSSAGLIRSQSGRLQALLGIAEQELSFLRQYGDDDQVDRAEEKVIDLQRQIAGNRSARALRLARIQLGLARTSAQWFRANNQLIAELGKQAEEAYLAGDEDALSDAFEAQQQARFEGIDRALDENKRTAIATTRLKGPISSKLTQLAGDIAATRIELASAQDSLQILELTVQLREQLAQQAQEELTRLGAFLAAQAGVNDSLKALKGQLVFAQEELELAAQQFGETSAEFYNTSLKIEQLKNELANSMLELEDINRRLGSDLTNDFEQAQLDLIEIAQKLKAPDLGPLEKARLELEKQKGLLAAEKAFFDDKLFELEFLKETGKLGTSAYVGALRSLLGQVDTTTKQGKEIFLQIQGLIDGLTNDVADMAFNIPTNIKLPTLFEVRRAVAADQLGVNYQDNRRQNIVIEVRDAVDLDEIVTVVVNAVGADVSSGSNRNGSGSSLVTAGSGF